MVRVFVNDEKEKKTLSYRIGHELLCVSGHNKIFEHTQKLY